MHGSWLASQFVNLRRHRWPANYTNCIYLWWKSKELTQKRRERERRTIDNERLLAGIAKREHILLMFFSSNVLLLRLFSFQLNFVAYHSYAALASTVSTVANSCMHRASIERRLCVERHSICNLLEFNYHASNAFPAEINRKVHNALKAF